MIDIVIQGYNGRMGRVLQQIIAERTDCRVVAGIDVTPQDGPVPVYTSLDQLQGAGDVLIDFSSPAATKKAIAYCKEHGMPAVICTTGLDEETNLELVELSKSCAVFKSANMSMGINLIISLAQKAAKLLGESYDVEIIEKHHNKKVDAPSGTALMIADGINKACGDRFEYVYDRHSVRRPRGKQELGISAVRGGTIVGEHEVLFCGNDEVITLSHSAASRSVFATGAVNAAVYLADKGPGLYDMSDMLENLL